MKKHIFTVTLEFADNITNDAEVNQIAKNIALALKEQVDHEGLAPEESDTFTTKITVETQKTDGNFNFKVEAKFGK